jgi:hypothetical protein
MINAANILSGLDGELTTDNLIQSYINSGILEGK